ncbi:MAG: kynureninase [Desulfobacteraceae bacterium]|nr:kynureninase [Desulfobacteraceae bacterium]
MPAANGTDISCEESYALKRDQTDALRDFKARFHLNPSKIYMDGNSLGVMSRDAEESLQRVICEWRDLGIGGWLEGNPPWFGYAERLSESLAPLVGAAPHEIITCGSTTINIHSLTATFLSMTKNRRVILMDELTFPTDRYAVESQLQVHGSDPRSNLKTVRSEDGYCLDEDVIIEQMTEDVGIVFLPSVLYRSGQLLDIEKLTKAAHAKGIFIGFDCAHSIGAVPHSLSDWGVDYACWCTYKYLNSGPGGVGGLYINQRHHGSGPALTGWWGHKKDTQFDMNNTYEPENSAGAWQIGTPHLFSMAPLAGSLALFTEADIHHVRDKSLQLTEYLMYLAEERLSSYGITIKTPRRKSQRGGHVALSHPDAIRINEALKASGVIPDFRYPDIIRLAPVALYTGFHDVWKVVDVLTSIMNRESYKAYKKTRKAVA